MNQLLSLLPSSPVTLMVHSFLVALGSLDNKITPKTFNRRL
jgi:hypothetical protein